MGAEALSLFGENIPKQHSAPGQQAFLEVRQRVDVQIFTMKVTALVILLSGKLFPQVFTLVFILLSACVLCNAAGDENSLKSLENTNDGQIRTAREAFASSLKDEDMKKGKKNKRKIKKRNKKRKSAKKQKGKAKKGRKEHKNKGKSQKSNGKSGQTKKGAKNRNKSANKSKKSKSSKKGKSKNNISKKKKNKIQEKKGIKKNKGKRKLGSGRQNNSSSSSSSSDCPDLQCIINAAQAFKVEKDTVKNFFKQKNRIESQLKTIGNKLKN